MTRFLLIRHAMTDANGQRLAGRLPGVRLNAVGRAQADGLARGLARVAIAAVYSSPRERAIETAMPIARLLGGEVAPREELDEIDFGELAGRAFDELDRDEAFQRFNAFRSGSPAAAGEFMLQVQARMVACLESLRQRHAGECIVVVSHGDTIKAAVAHYAGVPLDLFHRIEISPASVSVVELDARDVRIHALNLRFDAGRMAGLH